MILRIADWEFDIDLVRTMEYSTAEAAAHCDCPYCRNFYETVDYKHTKLRSFLGQFGLDIEALEEMFPVFVGTDSVDYLPVYIVYGTITKYGQHPLDVDQCRVLARSEAGSDAYFELECAGISLPWVLDEPIDEVRSPANEPSFLQKVWARLLRGLRGDFPPS